MADYAPPAGNAVAFDFNNSPYSAPGGNAVAFDFVASPPVIIATANSRMLLVM